MISELDVFCENLHLTHTAKPTGTKLELVGHSVPGFLNK